MPNPTVWPRSMIKVGSVIRRHVTKLIEADVAIRSQAPLSAVESTAFASRRSCLPVRILHVQHSCRSSLSSNSDTSAFSQGTSTARVSTDDGEPEAMRCGHDGFDRCGFRERVLH